MSRERVREGVASVVRFVYVHVASGSGRMHASMRARVLARAARAGHVPAVAVSLLLPGPDIAAVVAT